MYLAKNTSGQNVCFCLVKAADGTALASATVSVRRCLDGTFAATTGTVTEDSGGLYKFAPSQADTNGNQVAYYFTATSAIPVVLNMRTTAADMSDSVRFGLTALPNAAAEASGGIITRGTGTGQLSVTSGGVDVQTIKTQTVTCSAGVTVGAFVGNATAALGVDASGRVDIGKALGTAVTLDTNNVLNVSAKYWAGTAITATSIPVATAAGAAGGLFIAGTNAATTVTTSFTTTFTGNLTGSVGSVTGAVGSVTGAVGSVTARVTANTDQLAGQTVTAAAGVTFPSSVASPTNITAGTITTVTTLTNLPAITAGWLTATGIASNAITAAKIATDAIGAAQLAADAVTEIQSGLSTYAGGDTSGTTTLLSRLSATRAGYLDNLSAGAVALASGVTLTAAGLDAVVVETGLNARQALSIIAASTAGVLSGAATTTVTVLGAGVATTRISATVDSDGDRSAITLSPPA